MRIFVTGATGYIGFEVAQALRRAGHEVLGLCRSVEKRPLLERHEIEAVAGQLQEPEGWCAVAESCSVLVHAAADYSTDTLALDRATVEALIHCGARGSRPKTILYTSGVWIYGSTGGRPADETAPLAPPAHVSKRPETECLVLHAANVKGLVIRPGCVYGKSGGLTAAWFEAATAGELRVAGDGRNHWAMVHVDDLAELYVRAVEGGLDGEVFNATDRSRSTVGELVEAAARAAGSRRKPVWVPVAEAAAHLGPMAECLALDQHVDSRKAVARLGWQPRHGGFVDEADACWRAWRSR